MPFSQWTIPRRQSRALTGPSPSQSPRHNLCFPRVERWNQKHLQVLEEVQQEAQQETQPQAQEPQPQAQEPQPQAQKTQPLQAQETQPLQAQKTEHQSQKLLWKMRNVHGAPYMCSFIASLCAAW